ncbi:hypothetical protein AN958_00154 [Leucoagaricus sp. SymC.cos]|nr:hypothetical protein AN958_00154 [Leucoagaricus sp. SymC.cos]
MRSIFSLLSSKSPDTQPECLLPALERVVIRNPDNYDGEDITVPFVEMVKARRSVLGNHSFSFEAVDCDIEWTRSAQDGIRELSYDFDLNIKERSQEIVFGYFTEREKEIFTSDVNQKTWDPISGWNWVTWGKWQWGSNHQTLNHPWALPSPADISFPWANFNHSSSFTGNAVLPAASTSSSTIDPVNNGLENAEWMGTTDSLDPDMNFERDFAEWFNHPDDPLDLH